MRNAPRVWKSFWSLKAGETFFLGKNIFFKRGWFGYSANTYGVSHFLWPWLRVKTTEFVKKSHPIPVLITGRVNSGENCGQTHFVGDDCPGGHQSMNIDHTPEAQPEHERTGPAN